MASLSINISPSFYAILIDHFYLSQYTPGSLIQLIDDIAFSVLDLGLRTDRELLQADSTQVCERFVSAVRQVAVCRRDQEARPQSPATAKRL